MTEVPPLDANLISSEKANGKHILMLDLDSPSFVATSSTLGHNHVYIDADLELDDLKEIIDVLVKHGILQAGIKKQLDVGNCLTFRPPGVKKTDPIDQADIDEYKQAVKAKEALANAKPGDAFKDVDGKWEKIGHLIEQPVSYTEEIKSAYGVPPAQTSNKSILDKISEFKKTVTGKTSKHYQAEHAIKKGYYVITVSYQSFTYFFHGLAQGLGVDPSSFSVVYNDLKIQELDGFGDVYYMGHKLATAHNNFQSMQYVIEFNKDFIESIKHDKGGIPEGWPEWDDLVKVIVKL